SRRPALRVHREIAPARVARGDAALGLLTLTGRLVGPAEGVEECGPSPVPVELRGSRTVTYFLPTTARAELRAGPLRVTSCDPLGLFRRVDRYGQPATLLVHPRTVPLATLPSGRLATVDGPASLLAPGGTVTFHGLREYTSGDDLRHIHWRTSARTGTL